MRKFNNREKEIIKKLSEIDLSSMSTCSRFLQDHFFTKNNGNALIVNHKTKDVLFYIPVADFSDVNKIRKSNSELFELLVLIAYLKDERLLSIISPPTSPVQFEAMHSEFDNTMTQIGNKIVLNLKGDFLTINQPDLIRDINNQPILKGGLLKEYYDFIYENVFGLIIPSEELKELVKNDFQTLEEIQHEENMTIANFSLETARRSVQKANIAIVISVILALFSVVSSFYLANLQAKNETNLNSNQYNGLTLRLDSLTQSISIINKQVKSIVVPDTIKAKVVEPIVLEKDKKIKH